MRKIIISVTNDLVADNRVHKVATSLLKHNYSVLLIGRKLKNSLAINNRPYKCRRMRLLFNKGALFYAEYNFRLFLFLFFHKTDILLSNDLDTLFANFLISKLKNKKLVYDSHEYFTEVPELINRKRTQKIWLKIEKIILPKIKHSYTVCQSIADIYSKKYDIDMKVVRNIPQRVPQPSELSFIVPQLSELSIKTTRRVVVHKEKKIIIYQGAVNIGRGIEYVIRAMQFLENYVFWIIGDGDIYHDLVKLTKKLNLEKKVKFLGKIPFNELKKYTLQADLGISLEENIGLNYYYALPNKLFDYIHAEIPILASQLPEIKRIIDKYNIGTFIKNHDAKHIANKIQNIFSDTKQIKKWRNNLKTAHKELCWENEENILIKIFDL